MRGGVVYLVPDWPWPATTGSRLRPASIVQALLPFGPVTLLAADQQDSRYEGWSFVVASLHRKRGRPRKVRDHAAANLHGRGLTLQRALQDGLHREFAAVIEQVQPSLVVLTPPFFGPFVDAARQFGAVVVANADESLGRSHRSIARSRFLPISRRLRAALDAVAFQRMELRDYPRVDQVWSSNEIDAALLAKITGPDRVRIVPNATPVAARGEPCTEDVHAVAYVGSFGHPPNQAAAMELLTEIMPAIRDSGGPDRLVLIGRDPTEQMVAAAARDPDAVVTGVVDDIGTHLCAAGLLVVPLRSGAGTRIKILEAAALGVPVVSTRFGAQGLDFRDGVEILLAETPAEFARCVTRLTGDSALRRSVSHAAQEAVRSRFSQEAVNAAVAVALAELPVGPVSL
jgi:glycosyltransferase involved in cell wall biosynthesis